MNNDIKPTLRRALEQYGEPAQYMMAYEEAGELVTALARYERGRNSPSDVLSEAADAYIMALQVGMMFGEEEFEETVKSKIERLGGRLESESSIERNEQSEHKP